MDFKPFISRCLLIIMYASNVGVWMQHFSFVVKAIFVISSAVITVMTGMNQWYSLKRNYKYLWIVVKVEYIINIIYPTKRKPTKGRFYFYKKKKDANNHIADK